MFLRTPVWLSTVVLTAVVLVTPGLVLAQADTAATDTTTIQVNRDKRLETKRVRVEETKERASDRQEAATDRKEAAAERKSDAVANRCEQVSAAIESRLSNYDSMKEFRVNRYQSMKEQVSALVVRLDEAGYNTVALKTELEEFDALVQIFASDANAAAEALRSSKSFACGESEGEFKSQLEQAKAAFSKASASAKAVGEHYRTQLKPVLQALKEQAKNKQSTRNTTTE